MSAIKLIHDDYCAVAKEPPKQTQTTGGQCFPAAPRASSLPTAHPSPVWLFVMHLQESVLSLTPASAQLREFNDFPLIHNWEATPGAWRAEMN